MNISDEAVEAAAKALHARECGWNDWRYIHPGRGSYEEIARAALEAAAPHISARTWSTAYAQGFLDAKDDKGYRSSEPTRTGVVSDGEEDSQV